MNDFLNPYIAGAPVVEPSMFFGREDVFDWVEQNLTGRFVNHILVIHGQRRVGKTSVIKQLPNHLPSHFIQVFFDLQGRTHTSLDRFQWWLAREICRAIHQACGLSIAIPERERFSQDNEYLVLNFLPEVLSQLDQSILLLTFDEFDTLSEPEIQDSLTRPLIAFLRRLFDLPKLNFIFSIGSSGHKLENMQAAYTEFFKTALYRKISFLKQEDCARLISRPVEGVLKYESEAVQRIYAITSGHPYFTQLICHELFSLCQKTSRREITNNDVDSVLEDVIERGTVNLKFVWDEATDLEKWVLSSLAHELHANETEILAQGKKKQPICDDRQLASALRDQHVRYSENDLNASLVHLREKDVLTQDNHFVVELLCIWLLKNRPLDRVREELVEINPIANRYIEIGEEFNALGQKDKALESFQQALNTDPTNLRAQFNIANLHLQNRNYLQAVKGFEIALQIDEDDIAARSGLCAALLAQAEYANASGDLTAACKFYERVVTINPDHAEAHQHIAGLYAQLAEQAIEAGNAEVGLNNYAHAVEHAPEDSQLATRYTQLREEHTKHLIAKLLDEFQTASEQQDWEVALDAIQRALQLAPSEPTLLKHLEAVKDAPRLSKIASLHKQAQEMEQLERWEEAIQVWENCLQLKPSDETEIQASLVYARARQKLAADYAQAQAAIKVGQYNQAIHLLQNIIAQDASYKDTAQLLVDCLKVRPRKKPNLPAGWWRWAAIGLMVVVLIVGISTQWSAISNFIVGILPSKIPSASQMIGIISSSTREEITQSPMDQTVTPIPPSTTTEESVPTDTASPITKSFDQLAFEMTSGRSPDLQEDFSGDSLSEIWQWGGDQDNTLQDGALRVGSWVGNPLQVMNYILQIDLRFNRLSGEEHFVYAIRSTGFSDGNSTEYTFVIAPATGEWYISVNTDPQSQGTTLQQGNLEPIQQERWYELGVVLNNQDIWIFWDGTELFNIENLVLYSLDNHFGLADNITGQASLEIDNWRFWDLGTLGWMRNDWITQSTPTISVDYFVVGKNWQFDPVENEKYDNGMAVLSTDNNETFFTSEDIQGINIAVEVPFTLGDFPDPASLVWTIGKNSQGDFLGFEFFPIYGKWQIFQVEDQLVEVLASGWIEPMQKETAGTIMLLVDGDRVSTFFDDTFVGYAKTDRSAFGTTNALSVRSNGTSYTQVNIQQLRFWDLDSPELMNPERIHLRSPLVDVDNFISGWGWYFNPANDVKFQDGTAVLSSEGGETSLTRETFQVYNFAMEVSFTPRNMPDTASVSLILRQNPETGDWLTVDYYPNFGAWQIREAKNGDENTIASGSNQPIPQDSLGTILVIAYGENVSAFLDGSLLGSVQSSLIGSAPNNKLEIKNGGGSSAQLDIERITFWDLGKLDWMSNDWILEHTPKFMADNFLPDEGWQVNPSEDVLFQGNSMILYTSGGDTHVTRSEFTGTNVAMEVTFKAPDIQDSSSLIWNMGMENTGGSFSFEFHPSNGEWTIANESDQTLNVVLKGAIPDTNPDQYMSIMVVLSGNRLSSFSGNTFLGSADMQFPPARDQNWFGIVDSGGDYGGVNIEKITFWNLDEPEWMSSYWVTTREPTYKEDVFKSDDDWNFGPAENEKYEDNHVVLFTDGGETELTRGEIQGANGALYVSFIPRTMSESTTLVWVMRESSTGFFSFEYFPSSGYWAIFKVQDQVGDKLASGNAQATPVNSISDIMVVMVGDRLSAFQGTTFLGSVESSLETTGTAKFFIIRSPQNTFARVDVVNLIYWNLDG
jgi:tetratricopeptide (TPR) repeat protein